MRGRQRYAIALSQLTEPGAANLKGPCPQERFSATQSRLSQWLSEPLSWIQRSVDLLMDCAGVGKEKDA